MDQTPDTLNEAIDAAETEVQGGREVATKKGKNPLKIALKAIAIILLIVILIVGGYFAYVFISYYRIDDNQKLEVLHGDTVDGLVTTGVEYTISSYNVGFGAYSDDYSFFMDGGKESRGRSKKEVENNIKGAVKTAAELNPDFMLFQEVDFDATRSYGVDQRALIKSELGGAYDSVFAQNYDSPYLLYPFNDPHGANQSCVMTLSKYTITGGLRRSLPIEEGVMKLVDLDRCYSVSRIPVFDAADDSKDAKGAELVIFNVHLSAYTSDGKIAEEQLKMLFSDMLAEYKKGNFAIAGGDFNKDLLGNAEEAFGVPAPEGSTWAQAIPKSLIPKDITIVAPFDENKPVASCRNANEPYEKGHTFVITVDGFMITPNVSVSKSTVVDTGYKYSDHTAVAMSFVLEATPSDLG